MGAFKQVNFWRIANIFTDTDNFMIECWLSRSAESVGNHAFLSYFRTLLSALLQKKIEKIRIVSQRTIPAFLPELRGIRMDVEIEEQQDTQEKMPCTSIYDLEPHLQKDTNFPRHNRFYQAKIDSRYLKSGERDFSRLPDLYVLTITNFDVFGLGYMQYTMRNKCEEVPELEYDDGLQFIYFNTEGTKGGSPEIRAVLKYLKESTEENVTDEVIREIHRYVTDVKIRPEVKSEYMTFEEFVDAKARIAAKEAAEEATKEATIQDIVDLLEDLGSVSEETRARLRKEEPTALKKWLKLAAKAENLQEFIDRLDRDD